MRNKFLIGIVSVLLIPCLTADPSRVSAVKNPRAPSHFQSLFSQEALVPDAVCSAAPPLVSEPLSIQLRLAWEKKLEQSRSFWGTDLRLSFAYNAKAPSMAYDPIHLEHRPIGPFQETILPSFKEKVI